MERKIAGIALAWSLVFCLPALAAPKNQAITILPEGCTATLRFLQPKVAAGAINNGAHQAPFEVRVINDKGKGKGGVEVALPIIIKGGRGPEDGDPLSARLRWFSSAAGAGDAQPSAAPDGMALTDEKGIARGLFTSGNRTEKTVIQLRVGDKGGPTAEIRQVWNEYTDEKRWDEETLEQGTGSRILYKLRYHREEAVPQADNEPDEENWVPISGHKMSIAVSKLTINIEHPDEGPDEDGDGKPDGRTEEKIVSEEDADKTEWNWFSKYAKFDPISEAEEGNYVTILRFEIPKTPDGTEPFSVSSWDYSITDDNVHDED